MSRAIKVKKPVVPLSDTSGQFVADAHLAGRGISIYSIDFGPDAVLSAAEQQTRLGQVFSLHLVRGTDQLGNGGVFGGAIEQTKVRSGQQKVVNID